MICKQKSKLNGTMCYYVSVTIQFKISHLFAHIKDQTVLFQTIQIIITYHNSFIFT